MSPSLARVTEHFSKLRDPTHNPHPTFLPKGRHHPTYTILSILSFTGLLPTVDSARSGRVVHYPHENAVPRSVPSGTAFDWKQLLPSPELHWVDWNVGRGCARLEVPLDYNAPNGDKAAVALLRVKSKVPTDSKEYRGPVLFNPGGPGGSGLVLVEQEGDIFQQILGDKYDIVGFNPRGIGETTPKVSVFSDAAERGSWNAGEPPVINSTVYALPLAFSRALVFNQLIESQSKQAAQHASTAIVARDMLSIVKADGDERLKYWGVSYGTILCATYAAMFPDKVERLIIDGVVDFDDYLSGSWSKSLIDTDKALQFLYDKCASAVQACPLYAGSSELVRQRVEALLVSLKMRPFPALNGTNYGIIDFTVLKQLLFLSLYTPFQSFPPLASAVAALENGDGGPVLAMLTAVKPVPNSDAPLPVGFSKQEAERAVMCGEQANITKPTADIMQHLEELSKTSIFADVWTDQTRTSCAGWSVKASERFAVPFSVNTSFPLLVIGNIADPVTPLAGAQKASRTFGGSGLLTINTPGHSSRAATSPCTTATIRNYFRQGKLPATDGKVCEIEDELFGQNILQVSPN